METRNLFKPTTKIKVFYSMNFEGGKLRVERRHKKRTEDENETTVAQTQSNERRCS